MPLLRKPPSSKTVERIKAFFKRFEIAYLRWQLNRNIQKWLRLIESTERLDRKLNYIQVWIPQVDNKNRVKFPADMERTTFERSSEAITEYGYGEPGFIKGILHSEEFDFAATNNLKRR